jgi:hypothetical protein
LVRATLSFSKKLSHHIGAIKYFICDYNLTKCAVLPEQHYSKKSARYRARQHPAPQDPEA